jgi:hypothetical protein
MVRYADYRLRTGRVQLGNGSLFDFAPYSNLLDAEDWLASEDWTSLSPWAEWFVSFVLGANFKIVSNTCQCICSFYHQDS